MASGYHGSGYVPLQLSSLLKPKPQTDPNWELNAASEETTSIFQESVPYRTLSAIGFLKPILLSSKAPQKGNVKDPDPVTGVENWASVDRNTNTFELKFYFEDVEIQNCTAIEVESILIAGLPVMVAQKVTRSESDLCGDGIDSVIASDLIYYSFSGRKGTVRFREANNLEAIHEIQIFSSNTGQNGGSWYSLEDILDQFKTKVKEYIDNKYSPNSIEVEVFISTNGRLVIAWSGAAIKAATGGLLIDMNPFTSPIIATILNYFHYEGFKKDYYTYGTVSSGDGISFVRSGSGSGGELGSLPIRNMSNISSFAVAISPELSQFERDDSITPIAATGEIASFYPSQMPFSGSKYDHPATNITVMEHLFASKPNGNLSSPKIPFDKNYTLNSFTVSIVGPDKAGYLTEFIEYLSQNIKDSGITQLQERAMHCILTAKLF